MDAEAYCIRQLCQMIIGTTWPSHVRTKPKNFASLWPTELKYLRQILNFVLNRPTVVHFKEHWEAVYACRSEWRRSVCHFESRDWQESNCLICIWMSVCLLFLFCRKRRFLQEQMARFVESVILPVHTERHCLCRSTSAAKTNAFIQTPKTELVMKVGTAH